MKHDAELSVKFRLLKADLGIPLYAVKGILESIWNFAITNCPRGDIGRFDDQDIATAIEYVGDAETLISALIARGWLDKSDEHRITIHDWQEHAPEYLQLRLARSGQTFADGSTPRTTKLSKKERESIEKERTVRTTSHNVAQKRTPSAPPNPTQPNPTKANPTRPDQGSAGAGNLGDCAKQVAETLKERPLQPNSHGFASQAVRTTGADPVWFDWFEDVASRILAKDGYCDLLDLLQKLKDAQDPRASEAKGVKLDKPKEFLVSELQKLATMLKVRKTGRFRWLDWPEEE